MPHLAAHPTAFMVATTLGLLAATPAALASPVLPPEPLVLYEWIPDGEDGKTIIVSDAAMSTPPVRVVPSGEGAEIHSDWSHDGSMFTWEILDGDVASVWTANADGSDPQLRVSCPGAPCVQMAWPTFSSDDRRLLVTRYDLADNGDWGPSHLVLADLASGEQTVIASTADGTTAFYISSLSPDDTHVAVTLETYTDATQGARTASKVVVFDTDPATEDAPVSVTPAELFAGAPSWHPSEDRILFGSWPLDAYQSGDEHSQLYTVAADGSGLTQVTNVAYPTERRRPGYARWTPDGTNIIATVSTRENGELVSATVAYVDPTTGEVTDTGVWGVMPSLQPTRTPSS